MPAVSSPVNTVGRAAVVVGVKEEKKYAKIFCLCVLYLLEKTFVDTRFLAYRTQPNMCGMKGQPKKQNSCIKY